MDPLILGLDVGTTGTKAALIDIHGATLYAESRAYPTHFAAGNRTEQDPDDWWEAAQNCLRNLVASRRDLTGHIEAIAVSGQMQDLILTRGDQSICPAILYTDTRAMDEAKRIHDVVGPETLRQVTGNDQDAGSLLAKLLWMKQNAPSNLAQADAIFVGAHDFVVFKLCGERVADVVTASTTGLLDLANRTWAQGLLQTLGLSGLPLAKLGPGGTIVGHVDAHAAALTGLPEGLPVCHGPGDAGAATLGAGAGEPGTVYAYLGTSGWIGFTSEQRGNPDQGVWTLAHPNAAYTIPVAPIVTAGGCLEWLKDHFQEGIDYANYTRLAEQAAPSEILFLPYLSGERAPFRNPNARGAFLGLTRRTTRNDLYRAVLEGVAYAYRHLLDALGVGRPSSIVVTGGGAKSSFWMQLFADILNVPVVIPSDSQNVGVKGAALAAWVAQGKYGGYAPPAYFRSDTRIEPSSHRRSAYDAYYGVFRELHKTLERSFDQMQAASKQA